MIDKAKLLVALHNSNFASPERILAIRAMDETSLLAEIQKWGAPEAVLKVAGIDSIKFPLDRTITDEQVQTRIDSHLLDLGFGTTGIYWTGVHLANSIGLNEEWDRLAGYEYIVWAMTSLPYRVQRLFAHRGDSAWEPILSLVSEGVWPYGLSKDGPFICVDYTVGSKDKVARALSEFS